MVGIILTDKNHNKELFKNKYFEDFFVHKVNGRKFYMVKSINGELFTITYCGINYSEIASCTTHMITNLNINTIIHIGIGYNSKDDDDFEILVANTIYCYNNHITTIANHLEWNKNLHKINTNEQLNILIRRILSISNYEFTIGNVQMLDDKNQYDYKNITFIQDFESVPIAQICHSYQIPLAVVKVKIIDNNINRAIENIDKLTYNIIQEISYNKIKEAKENLENE